MDWVNQPDPFRRFSGARNIELPLVPDDRTPPYGSLFYSNETPPQPLTAESLGLCLELSLGLTAWKEFQGTLDIAQQFVDRQLAPDRELCGVDTSCLTIGLRRGVSLRAARACSRATLHP